MLSRLLSFGRIGIVTIRILVAYRTVGSVYNKLRMLVSRNIPGNANRFLWRGSSHGRPDIIGTLYLHPRKTEEVIVAVAIRRRTDVFFHRTD